MAGSRVHDGFPFAGYFIFRIARLIVRGQVM